MVIKSLIIGCVLAASIVFPSLTHAEEVTTDVASDSVFAAVESFFLGEVTIIYSEGESSFEGYDEAYQRVNVRVTTGPDAGTDQFIEYVSTTSSFEHQKLAVGDSVIITKSSISGQDAYIILDRFRVPGVFTVLAVFLILALMFAGFRGVTSLFGLAASLAILAFGVVPAILQGHDPLFVSVIGSCIIAVISILLAHGANRRSGLALAATLLTLVAAVVFAIFAVFLAKLSGAGTEEAVYLQIGSLTSLNLQGLLLGGIIIGTLGVLDDVTTTQVASVEEISKADASLSARELYKRGINIGREHIAALVNTLALAYAGASFPLFLLFAINSGPPLWVVLNAEYVMEEVIRAIVGGASLIIAVPISTAFAAYYYGKKS
ncbi:MAG: YibE/F family protein [Patescibacteria group bacterium]